MQSTHIHGFLPFGVSSPTLGGSGQRPASKPTCFNGRPYLLRSVIDLRSLERREDVIQVSELVVCCPPSTPSGFRGLGLRRSFTRTFAHG